MIDIVRGEQLIEIQTRNFAALRGKLSKLLEQYTVNVIYPIAREKWIIRAQNGDGNPAKRRKSPRRGRIEDLFYELVSIPQLALHSNFRLEVLITSQEEIWLDNGQGSWRRKGWSIADRRLLEVHHRYVFGSRSDYAALIPAESLSHFTTKELAQKLSIRRNLAQRMAYCLHRMGIIEIATHAGRARVYRLHTPD